MDDSGEHNLLESPNSLDPDTIFSIDISNTALISQICTKKMRDLGSLGSSVILPIIIIVVVVVVIVGVTTNIYSALINLGISLSTDTLLHDLT